jgi:hypothetical protein
MPRKPKPYVKDGWYCTSIGGTPHQKLCRVEKGEREAELALARLIVQRADAERQGITAPTPGPGIQSLIINPQALAGPCSPTVSTVLDSFMDVKQSETADGTYEWYKHKLQPIHERFGGHALNSVTYEEGLAYKNWLRKEKPWMKGELPKKGIGTTSTNAYVRAAKTFFEWASKPNRRASTGLMVNPWEEIKLYPEKPRERLITDGEMRILLEHCTDGNCSGGAQDFREQLLCLRHTTMQPGELRQLKGDYIDWDEHRIVFPLHIIKTRSRRETAMLDRVEKAGTASPQALCR